MSGLKNPANTPSGKEAAKATSTFWGCVLGFDKWSNYFSERGIVVPQGVILQWGDDQPTPTKQLCDCPSSTLSLPTEQSLTSFSSSSSSEFEEEIIISIGGPPRADPDKTPTPQDSPNQRRGSKDIKEPEKNGENQLPNREPTEGINGHKTEGIEGDKQATSKTNATRGRRSEESLLQSHKSLEGPAEQKPTQKENLKEEKLPQSQGSASAKGPGGHTRNSKEKVKNNSQRINRKVKENKSAEVVQVHFVNQMSNKNFPREELPSECPNYRKQIPSPYEQCEKPFQYEKNPQLLHYENAKAPQATTRHVQNATKPTGHPLLRYDPRAYATTSSTKRRRPSPALSTTKSVEMVVLNLDDDREQTTQVFACEGAISEPPASRCPNAGPRHVSYQPPPSPPGRGCPNKAPVRDNAGGNDRYTMMDPNTGNKYVLIKVASGTRKNPEDISVMLHDPPVDNERHDEPERRRKRREHKKQPDDEEEEAAEEDLEGDPSAQRKHRRRRKQTDDEDSESILSDDGRDERPTSYQSKTRADQSKVGEGTSSLPIYITKRKIKKRRGDRDISSNRDEGADKTDGESRDRRRHRHGDRQRRHRDEEEGLLCGESDGSPDGRDRSRSTHRGDRHDRHDRHDRRDRHDGRSCKGHDSYARSERGRSEKSGACPHCGHREVNYQSDRSGQGGGSQNLGSAGGRRCCPAVCNHELFGPSRRTIKGADGGTEGNAADTNKDNTTATKDSSAEKRNISNKSNNDNIWQSKGRMPSHVDKSSSNSLRDGWDDPTGDANANQGQENTSGKSGTYKDGKNPGKRDSGSSFKRGKGAGTSDSVTTLETEISESDEVQTNKEPVKRTKGRRVSVDKRTPSSSDFEDAKVFDQSESEPDQRKENKKKITRRPGEKALKSTRSETTSTTTLNMQRKNGVSTDKLSRTNSNFEDTEDYDQSESEPQSDQKTDQKKASKKNMNSNPRQKILKSTRSEATSTTTLREQNKNGVSIDLQTQSNSDFEEVEDLYQSDPEPESVQKKASKEKMGRDPGGKILKSTRAGPTSTTTLHEQKKNGVHGISASTQTDFAENENGTFVQGGGKKSSENNVLKPSSSESMFDVVENVNGNTKKRKRKTMAQDKGISVTPTHTSSSTVSIQGQIKDIPRGKAESTQTDSVGQHNIKDGVSLSTPDSKQLGKCNSVERRMSGNPTTPASSYDCDELKMDQTNEKANETPKASGEKFETSKSTSTTTLQDQVVIPSDRFYDSIQQQSVDNKPRTNHDASSDRVSRSKHGFKPSSSERYVTTYTSSSSKFADNMALESTRDLVGESGGKLDVEAEHKHITVKTNDALKNPTIVVARPDNIDQSVFLDAEKLFVIKPSVELTGGTYILTFKSCSCGESISTTGSNEAQRLNEITVLLDMKGATSSSPSGGKKKRDLLSDSDITDTMPKEQSNPVKKPSASEIESDSSPCASEEASRKSGSQKPIVRAVGDPARKTGIKEAALNTGSDGNSEPNKMGKASGTRKQGDALGVTSDFGGDSYRQERRPCGGGRCRKPGGVLYGVGAREKLYKEATGTSKKNKYDSEDGRRKVEGRRDRKQTPNVTGESQDKLDDNQPANEDSNNVKLKGSIDRGERGRKPAARDDNQPSPTDEGDNKTAKDRKVRNRKTGSRGLKENLGDDEPTDEDERKYAKGTKDRMRKSHGTGGSKENLEDDQPYEEDVNNYAKDRKDGKNKNEKNRLGEYGEILDDDQPTENDDETASNVHKDKNKKSNVKRKTDDKKDKGEPNEKDADQEKNNKEDKKKKIRIGEGPKENERDENEKSKVNKKDKQDKMDTKDKHEKSDKKDKKDTNDTKDKSDTKDKKVVEKTEEELVKERREKEKMRYRRSSVESGSSMRMVTAFNAHLESHGSGCRRLSALEQAASLDPPTRAFWQSSLTPASSPSKFNHTAPSMPSRSTPAPSTMSSQSTVTSANMSCHISFPSPDLACQSSLLSPNVSSPSSHSASSMPCRTIPSRDSSPTPSTDTSTPSLEVSYARTPLSSDDAPKAEPHGPDHFQLPKKKSGAIDGAPGFCNPEPAPDTEPLRFDSIFEINRESKLISSLNSMTDAVSIPVASNSATSNTTTNTSEAPRKSESASSIKKRKRSELQAERAADVTSSKGGGIESLIKEVSTSAAPTLPSLSTPYKSYSKITEILEAERKITMNLTEDAFKNTKEEGSHSNILHGVKNENCEESSLKTVQKSTENASISRANGTDRLATKETSDAKHVEFDQTKRLRNTAPKVYVLKHGGGSKSNRPPLHPSVMRVESANSVVAAQAAALQASASVLHTHRSPGGCAHRFLSVASDSTPGSVVSDLSKGCCFSDCESTQRGAGFVSDVIEAAATVGKGQEIKDVLPKDHDNQKIASAVRRLIRVVQPAHETLGEASFTASSPASYATSGSESWPLILESNSELTLSTGGASRKHRRVNEDIFKVRATKSRTDKLLASQTNSQFPFTFYNNLDNSSGFLAPQKGKKISTDKVMSETQLKKKDSKWKLPTLFGKRSRLKILLNPSLDNEPPDCE